MGEDKGDELQRLQKTVEGLVREMERLKARLEAIEEQGALRKEVDRPPSTPQREAPSDHRDTPHPIARRAHPLPTPPPVPPPKPVQPRQPSQVEAAIRDFFKEGNPLNKLGAISLLLGAAIVFKYAVDHGYIGPGMRVAIGLVFGVALFGASEYYARKHWPRFASGLAAASNGLLFLSVFFGHQQYSLISTELAFSLYVVFTSAITLQALRFDSQGLAVWGFLGGYLAPAIASTGSGNFVFLSSYLLVLGVGVFVIAYWQEWQIIKWEGFLFTSFYSGLWVVSYLEGPGETRWLALHWLLPFLSAFFLFFLALPTWRSLLVGETIDRFGKVLTVANGAVHSLFFSALLYEDHRLWLASITLAMALTYGGIGLLILRTREADVLGFRIFFGSSVGFFLLATPFFANGSVITLIWSLEMVLLAWFCTKPTFHFLQFHLLPMFFLISIRLIGYDDLFERRHLGEGLFLPWTARLAPFAGALSFVFSARFLRRIPDLRLPLVPLIATSLLFGISALNGEAYRYVRGLLLPNGNVGLQSVLQAGIVVALVSIPWLFFRPRILASPQGWGASFCLAILILFFAAQPLSVAAKYSTLLPLGQGPGTGWLHLGFFLLSPLSFLLASLSSRPPSQLLSLNSDQLQGAALGLAVIVTMLTLNREMFALVHAAPFDSLIPVEARRSSYRMLVSVAYTLFAFGIYLRGLFRDNRLVLWSAYGLYIFTAFKVYIFDLESQHQLFRAASLLVFAAILFVSSWFAKRVQVAKTHSKDLAQATEG